MTTFLPPTGGRRPSADPPPAPRRRHISNVPKARKRSRSASPPRRSFLPSIKAQLDEKYQEQAIIIEEAKEFIRRTEEQKRDREAAEEFARLYRVYEQTVDGIAQGMKALKDIDARTQQKNEERVQMTEAYLQHMDEFGNVLSSWGQTNREVVQSQEGWKQRLDRNAQGTNEYIQLVGHIGRRTNAYGEGVRDYRRRARRSMEDSRHSHQ
ncbi:hypothetical protein EVG20_g6337 [Dentipellis fragilis]|uniref:Uncharacterized protein n=1 Tax=Dentipellis fragilis TaxID=205917 RepID=A0A4Y9YQR9_9AGAM|nr:hypothetical protein EVG20_g6337 [Dentipellis fragilis]